MDDRPGTSRALRWAAAVVLALPVVLIVVQVRGEGRSWSEALGAGLVLALASGVAWAILFPVRLPSRRR